jgi:hypothetical protein
MDPVLATPSAWHLSEQFAAILEKVQMPPASLDGVVQATPSFTLRTFEMLPRHVFQTQFQAFWFSLKATFDHSPLPAQSQRCSKKLFRCHPFYCSPTIALKANGYCLPKQCFQKPLRLSCPQRGTSAGAARTQNAVTPRARSEACSRAKRNKWQGPASGGKDAVYVGFVLEQA